MTNHLILVNEICEAFPQEWPALTPVLEYLYDTQPQEPHGFSAHDMACGYAIASPMDRQLAPFLVPEGTAESDIAARLFTNWVELHGLFSRASRDAALRVQLRVNHNRYTRELQQGETVFRKLPHGARMQKDLFPAPSCGPYVVERQPTHTSVVLRDPKTGELVDRGA